MEFFEDNQHCFEFNLVIDRKQVETHIFDKFVNELTFAIWSEELF